MLDCHITIQWPLSFVLIGSEIEKEFLSCILAHPELFYRYPEYRFLSHSRILAQILANPASRIAVKALYPGADSVSR